MLLIKTESNQMCWLLYFQSPNIWYIEITMITSFGLILQGYFHKGRTLLYPTQSMCAPGPLYEPLKFDLKDILFILFFLFKASTCWEYNQYKIIL